MTNKLVVVINSRKVPKIKKMLLYEMKFLVPNYCCIQNPWLGGYSPQIPVLSVFCPLSSTEFVEPPEKYSWVRHWLYVHCLPHFAVFSSLLPPEQRNPCFSTDNCIWHNCFLHSLWDIPTDICAHAQIAVLHLQKDDRHSPSHVYM